MKTRLLLLLLLPACATAQTETTSTTTTTTKAETAPLPYTAEQIHDGCPPGHALRWQVTVPGQPVTFNELRFTARTADAGTLTSTTTDEHGQVQQQKTATSAWTELQKHAAFPADRTTISEKEVTVPAGTYRCQWYAVKAEEDAEMHFCFVSDLPGPPVFFDQWKGGQQVMKSELVELVPGG